MRKGEGGGGALVRKKEMTGKMNINKNNQVKMWQTRNNDKKYCIKMRGKMNQGVNQMTKTKEQTTRWQ